MKKDGEAVISEGLKDKMMILFISIVIAIGAFLLLQFISGFVTYADYNQDKATWDVILEKIENVEEDIREIKEIMKP